MAMVMMVVEVISVLLAPAVEVVALLLLLFAEAVFWLILLVVELIVALARWRNPKIPSKPRFNGLRSKLKSSLTNWHNKRENQKLHK